MNWSCPYCNRVQTVVSSNLGEHSFAFETVETIDGHLGMSAELIVCANIECLKPTVNVSLVEAYDYQFHGGIHVKDGGKLFLKKQIVPDSMAKPQPDIIPAPIREDYLEACKVRDLSPKASATLARRCLQGMIRDFCGISQPTLFKEISALKKAVDEGTAPRGVSEDSIDALDAIRKIGNIGAHMEKDINLIVDVEVGEAQILIEIIEQLFEDWYVDRDRRQRRFSRISEIAEQKNLMKKLEPPVEKLE